MSRLQKHFQKMYGKPAPEERDLGRVAEQEYQEDSLVYLRFPDGKEEPLFKEQHSALEEYCAQYGVTPEKMLEDKPDSISVSDHYVIRIRALLDYRAKDNELTIPEGFTQLQRLDCYGNRLSSLTIPATLTQLQELSCGRNKLSSLTIPETLTQLRIIYCYDNQLSSLTIPEKLTQLQELYCGSNRLSSLTIPKKLTKLQILHCAFNRLSSLAIPESIPLKILYCNSTNLSEQTKQELRERGVRLLA